MHPRCFSAGLKAVIKLVEECWRKDLTTQQKQRIPEYQKFLWENVHR